jgi:hypothetical protein
VVTRGGERGRMRQHERPPNERPKGRPRPRRPSFGADPRAVRSAEAVACRPDSAYGSRDFIQLATSCGLDLAALDALATAGRPEGEAAAVVLAQTLAASLPPPWSCHMDMTGDGADRLGGGCYYYNAQCDESQYDHPLVPLTTSRLLPLDLAGVLASGGWPSGEQAGGRRQNPTQPPHNWPPPNRGHPAAAAAHSPITVYQRSIAGSPIAGSPATAQPATWAMPELSLHGSPPPRPQPLLVERRSGRTLKSLENLENLSPPRLARTRTKAQRRDMRRAQRTPDRGLGPKQRSCHLRGSIHVESQRRRPKPGARRPKIQCRCRTAVWMIMAT